MLARFHGLAADPAQLAHQFKHNSQPFGPMEILLAAKQVGLQTGQVHTRLARLGHTPFPNAVKLRFFVVKYLRTRLKTKEKP